MKQIFLMIMDSCMYLQNLWMLLLPCYYYLTFAFAFLNFVYLFSKSLFSNWVFFFWLRLIFFLFCSISINSYFFPSPQNLHHSIFSCLLSLHHSAFEFQFLLAGVLSIFTKFNWLCFLKRTKLTIFYLLARKLRLNLRTVLL